MLLPTVFLCCLVAGLQAASSKRGFGVNYGTYFCGDTAALTASTWWYDWQTFADEHSKNHCSNQPHGEFVPMVWSHFEIDSHTLSFPDGTRHVLGFNEPNQKDQANLSPQEAARLWKEIENKAHGIKLISPAPSRCSSGPNCHMDPISWYDQFFAACQGCRIDALAAHTYSCNAQADMNYLQALYNKYHLKIWLTEFSCPYTSDETKVQNYMREVVPLLEKTAYVERYAWFITRWYDDGFLTPATGLLQQKSAQTTALGTLYNSL